MTLRAYLLVMLLATAAAWFGWALVLMNQSPLAGAIVPFLLFYVSLFFALTGTFSLIGFFVRFHTRNDDVPFRQVAIAFRQALSYAGLVIALLILQAHRLLTIGNSLFLIGAFVLFELFFITRRKKTVASERIDSII